MKSIASHLDVDFCALPYALFPGSATRLLHSLTDALDLS